MIARRSLLAAWLIVGAAVVLGPQLAAVVSASEWWPFTCAPMFARSLDDAYEPRFIIETPDGDAGAFDARAFDMPRWQFPRLVYVDTFGPEGRVDDARAAAFWSTAVARAAHAKKHPLSASATAIRVELVGRANHDVVALGRYDVAARTWTTR